VSRRSLAAAVLVAAGLAAGCATEMRIRADDGPQNHAAGLVREAKWLLRTPYDFFVAARDETPRVDNRIFSEALRDPSTPLGDPERLSHEILASLGVDADAWTRIAADRNAGGEDCSSQAILAAIEGWLDVAAPAARSFGADLSGPFLAGADAYLRSSIDAFALFETAGDARPPTNALVAAQTAAAAKLAAFFASSVGCRFGSEFAQARTIQSKHGAIVLGSVHDDAHAPSGGVVFVFDPAGDDRYELPPPEPGRVRGIADLAGNDRYREQKATVGALSILLDFGGDDDYACQAGGQAASVFGYALHFDSGGNNAYAASFFAQAATFGGAAILIGGAGEDKYNASSFAQAASIADGTAILLELGGSDVYAASGDADAFGRGGAISFAQGAALGVRGAAGGGVALLFDRGGNDVYTAEQFAQGVGYALGLGMLRDASGNDRYAATRYAQGAGIHGGIGVLVEQSGNDIYRVAAAVAQGAAIDYGIGAFFDRGGRDALSADQIAQGGTDGGGIALFVALGRENIYEIRAPQDGRNWGGFLPTASFPGYAHAVFAEEASAFPANPPGPKHTLASALAAVHAPPQLACPLRAMPLDAQTRLEPLENADFRVAAPLAGVDGAPKARFLSIGRWLAADPPAFARTLKRKDTTAAIGLREALRCHLLADTDRANAKNVSLVLGFLVETGHTAAPILAPLYLAIADGAATDGRIRDALASSESCSLRIVALRLGNGDRPRAANPNKCLRQQFVEHRLSGGSPSTFVPLTAETPIK
jgi:hypothetical protein